MYAFLRKYASTQPTHAYTHTTIYPKTHKQKSHNLLAFILVTRDTSHELRSPLKIFAYENTVTSEEGRLHSQPATSHPFTATHAIQPHNLLHYAAY